MPNFFLSLKNMNVFTEFRKKCKFCMHFWLMRLIREYLVCKICNRICRRLCRQYMWKIIIEKLQINCLKNLPMSGNTAFLIWLLYFRRTSLEVNDKRQIKKKILFIRNPLWWNHITQWSQFLSIFLGLCRFCMTRGFFHFIRTCCNMTW